MPTFIRPDFFWWPLTLPWAISMKPGQSAIARVFYGAMILTRDGLVGNGPPVDIVVPDLGRVVVRVINDSTGRPLSRIEGAKPTLVR
mgnify:CR=1 FL=1